MYLERVNAGAKLLAQAQEQKKKKIHLCFRMFGDLVSSDSIHSMIMSFLCKVIQ